MVKISNQSSVRQQRQLSYISEYTTDIQHVSRQKNNVADALSQSPISALHEGINFQEMATDQERDPEIHASQTAIPNLQLRDHPLSGTSLTLLCDILTDCERPLVPLKWRKRLSPQLISPFHPDHSEAHNFQVCVAQNIQRD